MAIAKARRVFCCFCIERFAAEHRANTTFTNLAAESLLANVTGVRTVTAHGHSGAKAGRAEQPALSEGLGRVIGGCGGLGYRLRLWGCIMSPWPGGHTWGAGGGVLVELEGARPLEDDLPHLGGLADDPRGPM